MPEEQNQFKRHIAFKFHIGDILIGKPTMDQERFSFLELGDKKIIRVNIIGNIVERYESEGESKYIFLTLDDGSGQCNFTVFLTTGIDLTDFSEGDWINIDGVITLDTGGVSIVPSLD
ncbi:MAG: OB-fold nucleic acid binding domain-containing protein, partial [Nanoarchaeota archaeon]|nr:OB-fold nucleic acid binding domain-containing protein [Nanoarchaeota archaeon]